MLNIGKTAHECCVYILEDKAYIKQLPKVSFSSKLSAILVAWLGNIFQKILHESVICHVDFCH